MHAPSGPLSAPAVVSLLSLACAGADPETGTNLDSVGFEMPSAAATEPSTAPAQETVAPPAAAPSLMPPASVATPPITTPPMAGAGGRAPQAATGGGGSAGAAGGMSPFEANGGGGSDAGAPQPESVPSYTDIYYMINLTCSNVVCHVPLYFMPDLSDANGDQYDILLAWTVEECGNLPLVTPGDIENSAILKVTKRGECGELLMPKGCMEDDCLPEEKRSALTTWIAAGAPR